MVWIVIIIIGAIVGWLASLIMKTSTGLLWNIIIGIVGALLSKWVFSDLLKIGSAAGTGTFTFYGILWAVIGAVILIAILKVIGVLK
jgi:uncharacterized membrane protein YeaQ/YmgE (transglycosylase-associated protein family)